MIRAGLFHPNVDCLLNEDWRLSTAFIRHMLLYVNSDTQHRNYILESTVGFRFAIDAFVEIIRR